MCTLKAPKSKLTNSKIPTLHACLALALEAKAGSAFAATGIDA